MRPFSNDMEAKLVHNNQDGTTWVVMFTMNREMQGRSSQVSSPVHRKMRMESNVNMQNDMMITELVGIIRSI